MVSTRRISPIVWELDRSQALQVSPQVSMRREEFGGLLYDFRTRRLVFLKDPKLVDLVSGLATPSFVGAAAQGAGVTGSEVFRYERAVEKLRAMGMLVERPGPGRAALSWKGSGCMRDCMHR